MGEEKKAEDDKTKAAAAEEPKKEEEKKDGEAPAGDAATAPPPPPPEVVEMRVFMHCEGCARKVKKSLKGFDGVEEVSTDCRSHKVVVKGKKAAEDPMKVVERVQKKTGRKVELLTPLPPPKEEAKKEDEKKEEEKPKVEQKKDEPAVIAVVLKVHMHCEACAQEIKKRILRMKEVQTVESDLKSSQVTVTGILDPQKLVEYVNKRTGKHAVIVKAEPVEKKPEEKAKAEEKGKEEKKPDEKTDKDKTEKKDGGGDGKDEKKELTQEEITAAIAAAGAKMEQRRNEFYNYYPVMPRYHHPMEYAAAYNAYPPYAQQVVYAPQPQMVYPPQPAYPPPQMFSDENPNACSVM